MRGCVVRGVMTMAPFDADEAVLRDVFAGARAARVTCCVAPGIRRTSCRWGCRATTRSRWKRRDDGAAGHGPVRSEAA